MHVRIHFVKNVIRLYDKKVRPVWMTETRYNKKIYSKLTY